MRKIRVLIVDDSVVIRRVVSDVLGADAALEVVGTAANGKIALQRVEQYHPDIVTLDIEMPEMSGLETVTELKKRFPKIPVIMFSVATERGAQVTLEALARGASDYVTKPANVTSPDQALEHVRAELIPRIKSLCPALGHGPEADAGVAREGRLSGRGVAQLERLDVLAIGVSTGGPTALAEVLPRLPKGFPVPILVVQHMPPLFTKYLAERLAARSAIQVTEGHDGDMLEAGHAYVAPGGRHMVLERDGRGVRVKTNSDAPENSCRPAVDVLFRSVASVFGKNALAVVLTGMGQDGLRGCEEICEAGGRVFAQDAETSVVWGMPGMVARSGLADEVLPLDRVADAVVRRAAIGRGMEWVR